MLVVESFFTWDTESLVDLYFDVVSFVTALTEKFQKYYPILTASDRFQNPFQDPPLLALHGPRNLRDTILRAKVKLTKISPSSPPKIARYNDGQCKTCKFIGHNTTSYTFRNTGQT